MERRLLISVAILLFITGMWIKPGFAQDGTWDVPVWMEQSRWELSSAEYQGKIYLTGGVVGDWFAPTTNELLIFDTETNTFSNGPDMPAPRNAHGSCMANRKLWVFGGKEGANTEAKKTIFSYSTISETWEEVGEMPIANCDFGIVAYTNTKVYIFGGALKMFGTDPYNHTYLYDVAKGTWEEKAPMPTPRSSLEAVAIDGKIYCIGGAASHEGGSGDNDDAIQYKIVEIYDPETDSWSTGADMSNIRLQFGLVKLGGLIYAINSYMSYNQNEYYHPQQKKWTQISGCNHKRGYHTACASGDSAIYLFGGIASDNVDVVVQVEKFKPDPNPSLNGKWTTLAVELDTARAMVPSPVHDGKIYLPGGWSQKSSRCLAKVSVFDPLTQTFSTLPSLPKARNAHGACFLNNKLYVFGGKTAFYNTSGVKDVWMFDPDSAKWIAKAPLPVANSHFGIDVIDNKAYIVGGCRYYYGDQYKSLYVYDPDTDSWEQKADMQFARVELSAVAYKGKLWALGGSIIDGEGLKIVEVYDPETDTWERGKDMLYNHAGGSASVLNDHIYMVGGWVGDNLAEAYDPILNIWRSVKKMNQARAYHTTCVVNDTLMYGLAGLKKGNAPNYVLTIEEFKPDTIVFKSDPTRIKMKEIVQNKNFHLSHNYPNPFNPSTTITYNLIQPGNVKLTVYNALGREVAELINDFQVEGSHSVLFDAQHLSTGIYFYQLQVNGRSSEMKKMVLLK